MSENAPPADVAELRASVTGVVLEPQDASYADECALYNAAQILTPRVVVGAATSEDVARAVDFARRSGLAVAVKNAGHQVVPSVGDDTLLITTRLADVTVDEAARTIRVVPAPPRASAWSATPSAAV
ncbi:FAD-binding protein [Streptomyces sp. NPDC005498]|uniref:FAD-binding protein n=1 Tax=Streptomyces sp. NPDC005498 TaxID=3364717 RepID=UPI0036BCC9FE